MSGQEYHQTFYNITHEDLYDILGFHIRDIEKYRPVFTHRSMIESQIDSYERLEFLGDAVLDLVISHKLMEEYPAIDEGKLSKLRANMVSEEGLVKIAKEINLGDFILLGKGEENSGGQIGRAHV